VLLPCAEQPVANAATTTAVPPHVTRRSSPTDRIGRVTAPIVGECHVGAADWGALAGLERTTMSDDVEPPVPEAHHQHAAGATAAALTALERRLLEQAKGVYQVEQDLLPAWLRPTQGEHRWQMAVAAGTAIGLQSSLPASLSVRPHYLLPILETALLVGLIVFSPGRIVRYSTPLRMAVLALIAVISIDNAVSAGLLVHSIIGGKADDAGRLLLEGVAIWTTNVIAFSLWYWEFDRGGPVARAHALHKHPDLLFPQMQQPDIAPPEWEPTFFDYLFTSFTNATAFSPTDTMPLSHWAKATFLAQSGISLVTVALVISRAVNIFHGG